MNYQEFYDKMFDVFNETKELHVENIKKEGHGGYWIILEDKSRFLIKCMGEKEK